MGEVFEIGHTYIDRKNNVMVQVDQSGNFGGLCLAFSPNEF